MEYSQVIKSTVGYLQILASDSGLRAINLLESKPQENESPSTHTEQAAKELEEYFSGKRKLQ